MRADERKFKRRCFICRGYHLKQALLRIRKTDAVLWVQWQDTCLTTPSSPPVTQGRSAYVCTSSDCLSKVPLQKGRHLAHALRASISPQDLESLTETLQNHPQKKHNST
ncbi:MAG: YlxR family protein [Vampirovibrionales bacterium]